MSIPRSTIGRPRHRGGVRILCVSGVLSLVGSPLWGQSPPGTEDRRPDEGSRWATYGASVGLGVAGFIAGGLAAGNAAVGDCEDLGCLEAAFYGAAALGTVGVALGAHLGNGRRGDLLLDLATAAGIWVAGIGPIIATGDGDGPYAVVAFIGVPIAQVVVTAAVERARGRTKARARRAELSIIPLVGRAPGLALRLRFQ